MLKLKQQAHRLANIRKGDDVGSMWQRWQSMRVSTQEADYRCTVGLQLAKNPISCDPAISLPGYSGHRHSHGSLERPRSDNVQSGISLVTERWRLSAVLHWDRSK